jgi:soluble lytic murein transglycosylase-like protein
MVDIHAEPTRLITDSERQQVYAIGKANGIPLSIVKQLMHEESRGYADAISPLTKEGYRSRGIFQIYDKTGNLEWLLSKYWEGCEFDIYDPIDNATVAMRYLSALHKRFGNWIHALYFYNHGRITGVSDDTRAYAHRIVNAR